jgi:hypothetical protein
MLYRMSTHLLDRSPERVPAFVDGVREKQELPRCGAPWGLLKLAFALESVADGVEAGWRQTASPPVLGNPQVIGPPSVNQSGGQAVASAPARSPGPCIDAFRARPTGPHTTFRTPSNAGDCLPCGGAFIARRLPA